MVHIVHHDLIGELICGNGDMTTETNKEFNPSALAAALNKLAEEYQPQPKTITEKLSHPDVIAAVKDLKRRQVPANLILEKLAEFGIETKLSTFKKYWTDLTRDANAKPERKSRESKPRNAAGTSEGKTAEASRKPEAGNGGAVVKSSSEAVAKPDQSPAERLAAKVAANGGTASEPKPTSNAAYRDRKSL